MINSIKEAREILNIPPLSSLKEIKKHYRRVSKKAHPDSGGSEDKMKKINDAYMLLSSYIENYKFDFSDEEIKRQYPEEFYKNNFRF